MIPGGAVSPTMYLQHSKPIVGPSAGTNVVPWQRGQAGPASTIPKVHSKCPGTAAGPPAKTATKAIQLMIRRVIDMSPPSASLTGPLQHIPPDSRVAQSAFCRRAGSQFSSPGAGDDWVTPERPDQALPGRSCPRNDKRPDRRNRLGRLPANDFPAATANEWQRLSRPPDSTALAPLQDCCL